MSEKPIYDGGTAYPRNIETRSFTDHDSGSRVLTTEKWEDGLSLRDYFAAHAIQGELACQSEADGSWPEKYLPDLAKRAYQIADAMLRARNAK